MNVPHNKWLLYYWKYFFWFKAACELQVMRYVSKCTAQSLSDRLPCLCITQKPRPSEVHQACIKQTKMVRLGGRYVYAHTVLKWFDVVWYYYRGSDYTCSLSVWLSRRAVLMITAERRTNLSDWPWPKVLAFYATYQVAELVKVQSPKWQWWTWIGIPKKAQFAFRDDY